MPPLGGVVAEDLITVVAFQVEGLLLVHHLDVVLEGALLAEPLPAMVAHEALPVDRFVVSEMIFRMSVFIKVQLWLSLDILACPVMVSIQRSAKSFS